MGFLWYMGNCYWIRDTMLHYGEMPTGAPACMLIGFSLVLGLYFAAPWVPANRYGQGIPPPPPLRPLIAAPFFWVALELLSARFTKGCPWDL